MVRKIKKDPLGASDFVYYDALYGLWLLPNILKDLMHTDILVRLRGITMGIGPNKLYNWVTLPSRFHHGMGVAFLIYKILEQNPKLKKKYGAIMLASALLHDAGSPAFSHASEGFLELICNMNGEQFLRFMLKYFSSQLASSHDAKYVLRSYGVDIEDVMSFVEGLRPIGKIIHGSIDADNIDNIARFITSASLGQRALPYCPIELVKSFKWHNSEWKLEPSVLGYIKSWQEARFNIYDRIYSLPNMASSAMLRRALYFAYLENKLTIQDFFVKTDSEGLDYLRRLNDPKNNDLKNKGFNPRIWSLSELIDKAMRWEWYQEVKEASYDFIQWPSSLANYSKDYLGQYRLADEIANEAEIAPHQLCIVMMRHNGPRSIDIRLTDGRHIDEVYTQPIESYFLKSYIPHSFPEQKKKEIIGLIADRIRK